MPDIEGKIPLHWAAAASVVKTTHHTTDHLEHKEVKFSQGWSNVFQNIPSQIEIKFFWFGH